MRDFLALILIVIIFSTVHNARGMGSNLRVIFDDFATGWTAPQKGGE